MDWIMHYIICQGRYWLTCLETQDSSTQHFKKLPLTLQTFFPGKPNKPMRMYLTVIGEQLIGEEFMDDLSIRRHLTDKSVVKEKMREIYEYGQRLVHDQYATSSVLDVLQLLTQRLRITVMKQLSSVQNTLVFLFNKFSMHNWFISVIILDILSLQLQIS